MNVVRETFLFFFPSTTTTTGVRPKLCFPSRDVEIILILAKVELVSLLAQRSPVRVDEGFLRLVFRLTFQFVPLLKQRATAVIDGAGIGPHGLFFRRVAFFDLFDARLQRVIVIRFDRLASRFGNEFPFHGFWIVEGGREAVVFGHVVGFPRDFFFHLSVFFQDVRGHPRFRRGKFFVRPGRFERRERPAWHVKCGDARALVHTAQAYAHHRSYTCSSVYRARAREREKKRREKRSGRRETPKKSRRARASDDSKHRHAIRSSLHGIARLCVRVQEPEFHARLLDVPV